jgi:hypothetical protein
MRSAIRVVTAFVVLATCLALGVACSKHEATPTGLHDFLGIPGPAAPAANSPAGALRLLQWCWVNRDADLYATVLAGDYSGKCSERDSVGSTSGGSLSREDELQIARHLFGNGTPTGPPATSITFDITSDLVGVPDARAGKNPIWHKQIRAQVLLRVTFGKDAFEIKGPSLFFLTRGDSASIPPDLAERGFAPDSARWYVESWEDESAPASAPGAVPNDPVPVMIKSLCDIKALYR